MTQYHNNSFSPDHMYMYITKHDHEYINNESSTIVIIKMKNKETPQLCCKS